MTGSKNDARPPGACPKTIGWLQDYVEGRLASARSRRFENHLSDCPGCVAFVNTYRATMEMGVAMGRRLVEEDLPGELRGKILSFVRSESLEED